MTDFYLASPRNQNQAEGARGHNVLISFATWSKWLMNYVQAFERILLDSGAFSVMNSGRTIDVSEYVEWAESWNGRIEAFAGLDDIRGDWQQSLRNYERGGFPTFHDSDPPGLLDDLVQLARERGNWIGIGLVPPRQGKDDFITDTLRRIPDDLHVHGWALRVYGRYRRFDSFDSTNWWRSAMELRARYGLHWLTIGECLEIQVKRILREGRGVKLELPEHAQRDMFA